MRQATIVPVGLSTIRPTSNFSGLVRGLIDDKYNREYKLDRRTRAKAIETLNDYYKKNQDEANVSRRWSPLFQLFKFVTFVYILSNDVHKNKKAHNVLN